MLIMSSTCFLDRGGKYLVAAMTGALLLGLTGQGLAQSGPRIETNDNTISVHVGDRLVARYRFEPSPFKPYLDQFQTPAGINVLRDSPDDHKHHHALMYAIAVDGLNFWEEHKRPGRQQPRETPKTQTCRKNGTPCSYIDQEIDWIDPKTNKLHMRERRTLEIFSGQDLSASLLTWQSSFSAPPGTSSIRLTGSEYFGLGVRFLASMDKNGRFQNADGKTGVDGVHKSKSRWCAYTADAEGKLVTFALFDHPDNARHPAKWFAMGRDTQPFAFMSATLNLHEEPYDLPTGRTLTLRYGAALWDGAIEATEIEKMYRRWVRLSSADRTVRTATE